MLQSLDDHRLKQSNIGGQRGPLAGRPLGRRRRPPQGGQGGGHHLTAGLHVVVEGVLAGEAGVGVADHGLENGGRRPPRRRVQQAVVHASVVDVAVGWRAGVHNDFNNCKISYM